MSISGKHLWRINAALNTDILLLKESVCFPCFLVVEIFFLRTKAMGNLEMT